jgi:hypothetical protein
MNIKVDNLSRPDITFWTAWQGEVKSMRTPMAQRRPGL